jgi:phosphate transport system substrate-binding protein
MTSLQHPPGRPIVAVEDGTVNRMITRRRFTAGIATAMAMPAGATRAAASPGALRISGTGSGTGGMALLAQAFSKANPGITVEVLPALGSAGGIRALIDGRLGLAVANRAATAQEMAQAPLASTQYARTPFVLALHRDIGIDALTTLQIADLYRGSVSLFPNGKRARPMLRRSDATDMGLLKGMSALMPAAIDAAARRPGVLDAITDTDAANVLESTPGAIGPCTLALILSERRPLVALKLDGIAPTLASFASGEYPHQKPLFMLSHAQPPAAVQRFIEFARSEPGRRILSAAGHAQP